MSSVLPPPISITRAEASGSSPPLLPRESALAHAQKRKPRLVVARYDGDLDPRPFPYGGDEFRGVSRVPESAGADGGDAGHGIPGDDTGKLFDRLEGTFLRLGRKHARAVEILPEPGDGPS